MIDSLKIGSKCSYYDFEASMKERSIGEPKKKSIKDTVPFSNTVYDFSKINGELYWEERSLKYVFEIMADSPEELEDKKREFKTWVMNVMEEELFDPYILDYHFIATFDDCECDDSEVEKSTIVVKFTAYPYMISNQPKIFGTSFAADTEEKVLIINKSSHRITPIIETDVAVIITMDGSTYGISAGKTTDSNFKLKEGKTILKIYGSEAGNITFTFREEVF